MFAGHRQTHPWVEQWKRVDRKWNRLRAAYGKWTPADQMMDLFFDFFLHTYQMRDWFPASGLGPAKVNEIFKSASLRLRRDIANGTKHARSTAIVWTRIFASCATQYVPTVRGLLRHRQRTQDTPLLGSARIA